MAWNPLLVAGTEGLIGYDENGEPITKPIEEIRVGDTVLSCDQGLGCGVGSRSGNGNDIDTTLATGVGTAMFRHAAHVLLFVAVAGGDGDTETLVAADGHLFPSERH